MASRGKTWSKEATDTLIDLWSEETIQFALNNSKTSKEGREVYNTLQVQLQTKGFEGFTVKEVINKMKKLRQKYKTEKDKSRKSGNGSSKKQWRYFTKMDNIMSERHIVNPPSIVDTMANMSDTSQEHLKRATAVACEEELIQKYGEGDMHVRTCDTCNYEQVIHSAGVHTSSDGSIKVYAEPDEFSCPNCEHEDVDEVQEVAAFDKKGNSENSVNGKDLTAGNTKCVDLPPKERKTPAITAKKKRKSNVEKSLEVVFKKFQETSETDFHRLQKLEEEKSRREHKFRLEQTMLENQRRREEREHEMHVLQLLMGYPTEHHTQDYTAHQQQQQPIRNNMYAYETTTDSHFPNVENSFLGRSFSGYGCASTSSNASNQDPNSYFEL